MRLRKLCVVKILVFGCFAFIALLFYWGFFDDEYFSEENTYDSFNEEQKQKEKIIPLDDEIQAELKKLSEDEEKKETFSLEDPVILWWTHFTGEPGASRQCGEHSCFFTNDRKLKNHKNLKVFLFYGTDFDPGDLPLPRLEHHQWALLHEESPKNNFILCFEPVLSLFNFTSTFRRESDFPLTTQHLVSKEWLLQQKFTKSVTEKNRCRKEEGLAPIVYVQSDCDPPSDRDSYVKQLREHIDIDSYGACLNNKKLPLEISKPIEGMFHSKFYELLSRYKFALAMENSICVDYITEKLWRPLMVGTVPVVFGSPKIQDLLPSNRSALNIADFVTPKQLADYVKSLDRLDSHYEKLREWKTSGLSNNILEEVLATRSWTPDNVDSFHRDHTNFVDGFECFVCNEVHKNIQRERKGQRLKRQWGRAAHLGCPRPSVFDASGHYGRSSGWRDTWGSEWDHSKAAASNLHTCVTQGNSVCKEDFSPNRGDF